jgi:hypothetical protein
MGKLTAKQAVEITNRNYPSMNDIFGAIKSRAEMGDNWTIIGSISEEALQELTSLGYDIESVMDVNIKIKW